LSRLLGIIALYLLMFLGWAGVGLLLVCAPARVGNLIHNSFGLLPEVAQHHRGKKLVLRLIGVGLLAFAMRFAFGVLALLRQGA
jgi:hypothetical protein